MSEIGFVEALIVFFLILAVLKLLLELAVQGVSPCILCVQLHESALAMYCATVLGLVVF